MSIASGTMQVYDFTDISEPTGDDMEDQDAMLATPSQDSSRKRETRWTERDRELRSFPMAMASKLFFFAACGMLLWMSIDDLYWADEVRNIPEPVLQADDDATWRNFRSRQSRLNNPGTSASASASASSSSNSYSRPSSFGSDGYTEDITWSDIRGSDGGDDRRSLRGGNRVLQQTPVSVPWDDLKFSQQIAAATLGYSPTSWNNGGATFTDSLRWNELTPGQQEAAEQLGYIEEIWNSLRGFSTTTSSTSSTTTSNSANPTGSDWGNFLWSELPADVQAHATNLGYTEDIWNNGQRTIVDDLFWDQLTPQQQFAATTFGYSESTWNVKAQPPTGKDIYPTDPPIPTGTSGGSSGNAIYPITEPPSNSGNTATTTNTNSDTGTNTIPSTGTSGGGSSGNSIYPITEPPSNSGSAGTTTNTNSGTSTNTIPNTGSGSSSSNSATTGDSASNAVDNVDASNRQPTDTSTSTTTTTGTSEQSTSTNGQTTSTSTSTSTTSSTTSTSSSQSATSSTNWRLYKWNELPSDIKAAAITMGFNEALWNSKADVATSEYSWNELSDAQQEAAALLFGYDQAKWDAEYNKRWQGYVWNDLPANIQRGAETLGYNARLWNEGAKVANGDYSWDELSSEQQNAAFSVFGFTAATWDAEAENRNANVKNDGGGRGGGRGGADDDYVFSVQKGEQDVWVSKYQIVYFVASLCFMTVGILDMIREQRAYHTLMLLAGSLSALAAMMIEKNLMVTNIFHCFSWHFFLFQGITSFFYRPRLRELLPGAFKNASWMADIFFTLAALLEVVLSYCYFKEDYRTNLNAARADAFASLMFFLSASLYVIITPVLFAKNTKSKPYLE